MRKMLYLFFIFFLSACSVLGKKDYSIIPENFKSYPEYVPMKVGKIPENLENELLGKIASSREVIGYDGKIIGRHLNGSVLVDNNFEFLGGAIPVTVIMNIGISKNNYPPEIIGQIWVDKEKKIIKAVDLQGNDLGRLTDDGYILNSDGEVFARTVQTGKIIDKRGEILGYTYPIRNSSGKWVLSAMNDDEVFGFVEPAGTVLPKLEKDVAIFQITGYVVPYGASAIGEDCKFLGFVSEDGIILGKDNKKIGHLEKSNIVVDDKGNEIGKLLKNGPFLQGTEFLGYVDFDAKVLDKASGQPLEGKCAIQKGLIGRGIPFSKERKVMGSVAFDGTVWAGSKNIGKVDQDGVIIEE